MDFRCLKFILILACVELIWSLPLACPYNGTAYKEGETVRTEEPCLSCVCQKGALECSLRVCAEYPSVLPPGCLLVHKPNECCPQLLCEERFSSTEIEVRRGFQLETKLQGNDCKINGSIYMEGSALASSRVCEYCYCIEGEMQCIKPRCLKSFEGCKAVYEKSSCCPTHYDCRDADLDYLTTQIKNFERIHPTVARDSLRSFSGADPSNEKAYFNSNDNTDRDFAKTEETPMNETTNMTDAEINSEETTVEPEKESTVPLAEDNVTISGFQTTTTENSKEESTEATTFESVTDTNTLSLNVLENQKETFSVLIRSELDSSEGIESSTGNSDNSSSQDLDDYDSYDYNEPRLPPSLPNLVIFPFVAADAVVKEESADMPTTYKKVQIERIDEHFVRNKDYFSPPLKTEGGFVPKDSSKLDQPIYENTYLREQMEPPSEGLRENAETQFQTNSSPNTSSKSCVSNGHEIQQREILQASGDCITCACHSGEVVCQDVACPQPKPESSIFESKKGTGSILGGNPNMRLVEFSEAVRNDTGTEPDFKQIEEVVSTKFQENHLTKKPVTVTYKNFVVDFYPNHLVTTARGHFNFQSAGNTVQKTSDENFQPSTQNTQNTIVPLTTTNTPNYEFYEKAETSISAKETQETTTERTKITTLSKAPFTTTTEVFFTDELVKSFLSKDPTSEATTASGTAIAKHIYSSKIKGQISTTLKPKQEEIKRKLKPEMSEINTTSHHSGPSSMKRSEGVIEKTKNHSGPQKPARKEEVKQIMKIPFDQLSASFKQVETKNVKIDYSGFLEKTNPLMESWSGNIAAKPNEGTVLKLAGCNIYGMMYRVGKIIMELSGPCLECLCGEFGVQCTPLEC